MPFVFVPGTLIVSSPETKVMKKGSATAPPTMNMAVAFGAVAPVCTTVRVGNAANGKATFVDGQVPIKAEANVKTAFGLAGVPTMFAEAACCRPCLWMP